MDRFRIDTDKLITSGLDKIQFDPKKVVRVKLEDIRSEYSKEARRVVIYKYEDMELALKMFDLGYSNGWNDTAVSVDFYRRSNVDGLLIQKRIVSKLRKSPNGGFTKKSLERHEERVKNLDQYDMDYATEQFRQAIEHFNKWYVDEQTNKIVERYSEVGNWKYEKEEEITKMDEEIEQLRDRLSNLIDKKFDKMCDVLLQSIKSESLPINEDFKQPLIEAVKQKREEGYKRPFFV